jgi:molybdopterin-guanine dinucleotide biosynthesis protein A
VPKGLQTVGGVRIIDRVARALRTVTPELVLVSNAPDAAEWLGGVPVVRDVRPERGALVGIHAALTYARSPVVVVAWDMPFVTPELLQMISAAAASGPHAVICEGVKGWEPCCAWYAPDALPFIDAMLDAGERRLGALPDRLPRVERLTHVDVDGTGDPTRLFFNVNTEADLAAAETMAATE